MFKYQALICRQCLLHGLGRLLNEAKEETGRALGMSAALLPIPDGTKRKAVTLRKFRLSHPQARTKSFDIDLGECMSVTNVGDYALDEARPCAAW